MMKPTFHQRRRPVRIAQINVVASLSTGRIAVQLCRLAQEAGHKALLCHSRDHAPKEIASYRMGCLADTYAHMALSRLTDRAGFYSRFATRRLVRQLKLYKPDLIHLHNLHGYYLHLPTLFAYLKEADLPVVWTLHDCWAFTGHCAYYTIARNAPPLSAPKRRRSQQESVGCDRWKGGCGQCVLRHNYPSSLFLDQSARNWTQKRELFTGLKHMVLVTPSEWLRGEVKHSFLKSYPVYTLPNGIDLEIFRPCADERFMDNIFQSYGLERTGGRKLILSVAAVWDERKGLADLIALAQKLGPEYCVAAVGLDAYQIEALPKDTVLGIRRTGNVHDLCALYTAADLCLSPSHEESMGMTLLEALACGTQVLCYDATAMPEIVTSEVGEVVPLGNIDALADAARRLCGQPKAVEACLARAAEYESNRRFSAYIRLYENMYRHSPAYLSALERAGKTETSS